ncbi:MAG: S-layer homology domain-containing protein [Vallitaleaceae bacterium]|nr:S-layer homology domain-containing protein [Vallitaleaceae bacterium]
MNYIIPFMALGFLLIISRFGLLSFAVNEPDAGNVSIYLGEETTLLGNLFKEDETFQWLPNSEKTNQIFINNNLSNAILLNWAKGAIVEVRDLEDDGSRGRVRDDLIPTIEENYVVHLKDNQQTYFQGLLKDFNSETWIQKEILGNARDIVFDISLKMLETAPEELENVAIDLRFSFDFDEMIIASTNRRNNNSVSNNEELEILDQIIPLAGLGYENHWAKDYIDALYAWDVLTKIPGGPAPDLVINRGEAAVLLMALNEIDVSGVEENKNPYLDELPEYAYAYIVKGTEMGILEGYTDGYFRPYDKITREEFSEMIDQMYTLDQDEETIKGFMDYEVFKATWGLEALKGVTHHELLIGYPDGLLRPKEALIKAQAYTVLYRLKDFEGGIKNED